MKFRLMFITIADNLLYLQLHTVGSGFLVRYKISFDPCHSPFLTKHSLSLHFITHKECGMYDYSYQLMDWNKQLN
jgi:hypothetical protein